jgi:hypothetical protein
MTRKEYFKIYARGLPIGKALLSSKNTEVIERHIRQRQRGDIPQWGISPTTEHAHFKT